MEETLRRVEARIQILQDEIAALPPGKLVCAGNGNRVKWYYVEAHKRTYIPKADYAFAEEMAIKTDKMQELADLENQRDAILAYMAVRKPLKQEERVRQNPKYAIFFADQTQELQTWAMASYEKNPVHSDGKIHCCCNGEMVRSKAESMIAQALYVHQIPFRYECALRVGPNVVYPDFTIRHPVTGEVYYWEHFGMMDDGRYAANVGTKLNFYISQGIIPSIHLIETYEMKDKPLSAAKIESIIQAYFSSGV